jgi:formylglycine-generating enzyme required for sulfatase activity
LLSYAIALGIVIACFTSALAPAEAQRRVALAVGIDVYDNLSAVEQLQKAVNDARAVGKALAELGFDTLPPEENVSRLGFDQAWQRFLSRLQPGDIAAVFFAGHGVEIGGLNYLLPRDVPRIEPGQDKLLARSALRLNDLMDDLSERKVGVSLLIVDACRDNPFRDGSGRSVGGVRGLTHVTPPGGSFVMYSAGAGETALDRLPGGGDGNPNSVYTRTLLPILATPGLSLQEVALRVREGVVAVVRPIGHRQTPAYYDQLLGKLVLKPSSNVPTPPPPLPTGASPAQIAQFCQSVAANSSMAVLESMLDAHRDTALSSCIEARIKELTPKPLPPPVVSPLPDDRILEKFFQPRPPRPLTAAEERRLRPKQSFRECDGCPEMVVMPVGSFAMGSPLGEAEREPDEGPQQWITIPRPFALGRFEVTRGEVSAFLRDTGRSVGDRCHVGQPERRQVQEQAGRSFYAPGFLQGDRHPAVCVSFEDATAFAGWLSRRTGKTYRLPTEAEWEYAARAGTTMRYAFGDTISTRLAHFSGSVWGSAGGTAPVATYPANAFGLYDMHGNVWEWVQDCWHGYQGRPADGSVWMTGDCGLRVVRGGAWISFPQDLRSANRFKYTSLGRYSIVGFRLARTL